LRVQFQTAIAGHLDDRRDFVFRPGQVAEVADEQARAWVASGVAIATHQAPPFTGFDAVTDPLRLTPKPSRKRVTVDAVDGSRSMGRNK
jgi:hypothetical protein